MGIKLLALLGTIGCLVLLLYQAGVVLAQEGDGTVTASFRVIGPAGTTRTAGRGTAGRGTAGRGTAGRGIAGRGIARRGIARRGTAGRGTAGRGTAGRGTAGRGTAGRGIARRGAARRGAARRGTARRGPPGGGPPGGGPPGGGPPGGGPPGPSGLGLQASLLEASTAEVTLEPLVAADLQLTGQPLEIVRSVAPDSTLTVALPLTGAAEGPITGDINLTLGNLYVHTADGETTANIRFDSALTVVGTTSLVGTAGGGINLKISDLQLLFNPLDPDVSLLPGGDPTVTEIGASSAVDLTNLPDRAELDVIFAKDTSTLLSEPGSKFLLLAGSVDGEIGDLSNDIAFGIKVVTIDIGDADLGDTEVTLEASKAWFDTKISEGKRIFIAKFNDAGDPVPPPQNVTNTCTATSDPVVCTATLTGVQGSLSVFALAAITVPNTAPVATAAFSAIDVISSKGTFSVVATGSESGWRPNCSERGHNDAFNLRSEIGAD